MVLRDEKRRRTHDENTPARRPGGSRTPLTSSRNVLRSSTNTHTSSRTTTPNRPPTTTASSVRRPRRQATDENAVPTRTTEAKEKGSRRALGLGEPSTAPSGGVGVPGKTARRAALGQISEQAAQTRPILGRPLPRPAVEPKLSRREPRRQNTAPLSSSSSVNISKPPPEAPHKAGPSKSAPRTPLGSVRRNLFSPETNPFELNEDERERLATLGATTKRTKPPPITPRAQIGPAARRRRLPPLPEPPTAQPAEGHPYSTHPHPPAKREKRKINVLEDPEECTTQPVEGAERWTPSPETHRTAVTERRLLREAFAPEPDDGFEISFEMDVELPELDLEDDAFLI